MGGEVSKMSPAVVGSFGKMAKGDVTDDKFWNALLQTPQLITGIPPETVRKIVQEQPVNVARLARACVGRMHKAASVQGNALSVDKQAALNAASILTGLLPVLFESEAEHKLVETIFWKGLTPGAQPGTEEPIPIAEALMNCILCLLLRPGFGCDAPGCPPDAPLANSAPSRAVDVSRSVLLKLMLVTCSETLYVTPDAYKQRDNMWLRYYSFQNPTMVTPILRSMVASIFGYDPVGMGIPYSSSIGVDTQEVLVDTTLHTLIAFLDYTPASVKASADNKAQGVVATEQVLDTVKTEQRAATGNTFRDSLRAITGDGDVAYIFKGMSRLLNNPSQASSSYLVGSIKEIACTQELLIVLWKLIDENKDFLAYILRACDVNEIVVPVLVSMFEARKDPSKLGLIHISTFIMLLLSGERNFCVNLNATFIKRTVKDLPVFTGCNADLLYIVYHRLITEGPPQLESLYDCFLTTMSNVSPYIKTFSLPAASRAAGLFELFASKNRLLKNENMPRYLVFLLEIFNNAVQYQYEGNPHLTYQVLRRKKVFAEITKIAEDPKGAVESLMSAKETGDSKAAFKATPEWISGWADQLPLQPCLRLLQHLLPQLEEFCTEGNVNDESVVVEFLKTTTMVGLLPVPHPILIRKYQQNEYTSLWFTTYVWGVIYLRNSSPPLFEGSKIKLFTISYVDA